ncbi:MAG: hypothetical protein P8Y53_19480 [Pseudolabrys sp.]
MRILLAALLLTLGAPAIAMPCDSGYACKSASGKYSVEIRRCRYDNRLSPARLTIDGKRVAGVTLGPSWDGDRFMAFQLNFPTKGDVERVLSVEVSKPGLSGTLRDETCTYNPGPWKVKHHETIRCSIQG